MESWRRHGHAPPPDALVFATIRRRAIDLARREQRREAREQAAPEWFLHRQSEEPASTPNSNAVSCPHLREVVVLKTWSALTFQEIGETLGVPLNTAASRYRYALEHLREAMKEVRP